MRRRHTTSLVFFDHYQDLGISSRKRHDSACNRILSVGTALSGAIYVRGLPPFREVYDAPITCELHETYGCAIMQASHPYEWRGYQVQHSLIRT